MSINTLGNSIGQIQRTPYNQNSNFTAASFADQQPLEPRDGYQASMVDSDWKAQSSLRAFAQTNSLSASQGGDIVSRDDIKGGDTVFVVKKKKKKKTQKPQPRREEPAPPSWTGGDIVGSDDIQGGDTVFIVKNKKKAKDIRIPRCGWGPR